MRYNPLYARLKQIALDNNYTIDEVQGLTKQQIADQVQLSIDDFSDDFFANIKTVIVSDFESIRDHSMLGVVKSQLEPWLVEEYPDAEFERGKENDKRFIKIWLDGKPEVEI